MGTATVKNVAARLQGEIGVVSGEVRNNARRQALLNRKVSKEMGRIVSLSNQRWSAAKRARGQLRKVMAANKLRAARMVNALAAKTAWRLAKVRRQAAHFRRSAAKALSRTTKRLYVAMTKNRLAQKRANKALKPAEGPAPSSDGCDPCPAQGFQEQIGQPCQYRRRQWSQAVSWSGTPQWHCEAQCCQEQGG